MNDKKEQDGKKQKVSFKQKTKKFGVALAKIMAGVGTTNDWIVVIKFAIPFVIAQIILCFGVLTVIVALVFGSVDVVHQTLENITSTVDSWFHNDGLSKDERKYLEIVKQNQQLGCKKSGLITETLMYYYQSYDKDMDFGDPDDTEIEEEAIEDAQNSAENNSNEVEIDYGKLLPDLKRLSRKMKKGEVEYEKYVKDKFLEKKPYKELLDGYKDKDEREKRKNEIYDEIKSIAYSLPCHDVAVNTMSGTGVCTYKTSKGITASDVKVRLLSCGNIGTPSSALQDEGLIDLETYITGVVYQEVGGASDEVIKAQAVVARNFLFSRNSVMGGIYGAVEQIDGQWVVSIRACTADQAFCHPDRGCWSNVCGGEYYWGKNNNVDATYHSGYTDDVSKTCRAGEASYSKKFGKAPLATDDRIRGLVKETLGEYAVDENGNAAYLDFTDKEQQDWARMEAEGLTYKDMIKSSYSNVSEIISDCTYVGTGQVRLPLDEGTYTITSHFGGRESPGGIGSTNHGGLDMGASEGTPIYAVAPGQVEISGWYGGYGNAVILSHDLDADGTPDLFTLYGHQSEVLVTQGSIVSGGQIIGKVGSTGNSTGPHLHFEIRVGSDFNSAQRQDPEPYLEGIKQGTSIFNQIVRVQEKYYNQGDYSKVAYCEGMKNATIQSSGCLPTSFAMVVAYLKDSNVTPTDVANNICNNYRSYRVEGSGTSSLVLSDSGFLAKYNVKSTKVTQNYEEQIKSALKLNKIIIVNVRGGQFNPSNAGHYIVITNTNTEGMVKVLDPGSRARTKEYPINEVTSNISDGIWIFE